MVIQEIFKIAIQKNASDIHLVIDLPPILRIDGELTNITSEKLSKKDIETLAFSLLTVEQKKRFIDFKDLDFSYEYEDGSRFRINLYYEKGNVGMVARVIPNEIPTMEDIGMPQTIYELLNLKQGLILVTGPTGCGKSTTLAAMINYLNENFHYNIVALEDPIEYIFPPKKSIIAQRQLGTDMLSFNEGLKHALRQDPNVVMVGEMRDLETIATTITLAETGHLVLATLHTYSAAQTIDRIIDIFPPHQQNQVRMQLSITLAGVISQRLLPKVDGGRIAAREILINTPAVGNIIRENKIAQLKTVIETGSKEGMTTLNNDLLRLFKKGLVTKEAIKVQIRALNF
jgi:twitching motility protein PilT